MAKIRSAGRFARTLRRLRAEAGFRTAYRFYHGAGGRATFPFSYAYYTQIERGSSLPRGEWLPLLLSLLGAAPDDGDRRALLTDYLKDCLGRDEIFETLYAPLMTPPRPEPSRSLEQRALGRLVLRQSRHLTPDQFRAMISSPAAYWSYVALTTRRRGLSLERLAQVTGFPPARVKAGVAALRARKMVVTAPGGAVRCAHPDRYGILPRNYKGYEEDVRVLRGYWDEMSAARGGELFDLSMIFRAPTVVGVEASESFRRVIEAASAASVDDESSDAPTFLLRARISRPLTL